MQVGLGRGHILLDGTHLRLRQRGTAPSQFSAHIRCGQMAAYIKLPLGMEVGLGPGNFVLDGEPRSLSPKKGWSPQIFGPCFCGQTAGWIKMVLGMVLGLSPGDFVPNGVEPVPKFSAHVYYSYCDFVRTWHRRKTLLVCSRSS